MPSRQDQLHSYQYSQQRVVAALVSHDPDPHRSPLRRAGSAAVIGLVVACLAVGGSAVYGLLKGNSDVEPRDEAKVFLEKGSGARFVYLKSDDRMHPVINYSSALLITSGTAPALVEASAQSLAEVPLGDPLGIPGAPDSMPAAKGGLVGRVWTVCSRTPSDPGSGTPVAQSLVMLGDRPTDGTVLPVPRTDTAAADLRGLLVTNGPNQPFLVYNNKRFEIPAGKLQQTQSFLGWTAQPLAVSPAWLNAVPLGPGLEPPDIDDLGEPSSAIDGLTIGQLLEIATGTPNEKKYAVALDDGVSDLTLVQAQLMKIDEDSYPQQSIDLNLYSTLPRSKTLLAAAATSAGLPPAPPVLLNGPEQVCLTYDGTGNASTTIRIGPTTPGGVRVTDAVTPPAGSVKADLVHVPRGKGALVTSVASDTAAAAGGTVSLVTDTGKAYAVANRNLLSRLGYAGVEPAPIPSQLVSLLPDGVPLDPVRARQSISGALEQAGGNAAGTTGG